MKKVLIIAAEYPPSATVGAKRPAKLAARIAEHGWSSCVLTLAEGDYEITDTSSVTEAIQAVPTARVPCSSIWIRSERWRQASPGLPRLWAMMQRFVATRTQRFLPTDKYYPWNVRAVSDGIRLVRDNAIDLIWATSPPLSGPDLAWRISRKTSVPFVVDYRDVVCPPAGDDWPRPLRRYGRRQAKILRDAAGISYVAPYQIEALGRSYPFLSNTPSRLVTNWFECGDAEAGAYEAMSFDRPTILHAGKLYGGQRRLDGLFDAMALLAERRGRAEDSPRFLHLDPMGVNADLEAIVQQKQLTDLVDLRPAVDEPEFRRHCRAAGVLLLVVGHNQGALEHSRTIPGKLYEYFSARRPILVIGPPDCQAGKIVTDVRRGLVVADDDPEAISDALATLLDPQAVAERFDLSIDAVRAYEAGSVITGMCQFFDEIVQP